MHKIIAASCCVALASPVCAMASATPLPEATHIPPTQIHFVTTANYRVADTELHATLSAQASGADPAVLASQVNQTVSWADTQVLSSVHGLQWHIGGYTTMRTGDKAVPWRVQETMVVESTDPSALLPLLGTLQSRLHLEGLNYTAAPKKLRNAKNHAGVTALHRFLAAAKQDCAALSFSGKPHLGGINLQLGSSPMPTRPYPIVMAAVREVPGPVVANPDVSRDVVTVTGTAYCR
ncbi:hypothetical protein HAP94_05605 [Acidithiobacillus ferrivorans]|nr:hypothetical protein [Acidithiobacillus ferrivorans]